MKRSILWIVVFFVAGAAGCHITEPDPFAYNNDPIARATGARWWWEGSQHFDAGVVIIRYENPPYRHSSDVRMAFDVNNNPVQISGAEVNGVLLQWIPTEQSIYHANIYETQDSNAYGSIDSATFSYTGYDGESWTERVDIAPDFGTLITPDTVTISQGLTIHYQNPVPGDSIKFVIIAQGDWATKPQSTTLYLDTSLADIGSIIIPSNRLPNPAGTNGYIIEVSRFHFISRTSPNGKVIGIYSEMDADGGLDAKP